MNNLIYYYKFDIKFDINPSRINKNNITNLISWIPIWYQICNHEFLYLLLQIWINDIKFVINCINKLLYFLSYWRIDIKFDIKFVMINYFIYYWRIDIKFDIKFVINYFIYDWIIVNLISILNQWYQIRYQWCIMNHCQFDIKFDIKCLIV